MFCKFDIKRFIFLLIFFMFWAYIVVSAQSYNRYYYEFLQLDNIEPVYYEGYEKNGNTYIPTDSKPILIFEISSDAEYYGVDVMMDTVPYTTKVECSNDLENFSTIGLKTVNGTPDGHIYILSADSRYIKLAVEEEDFSFTVTGISLLINQTVEPVFHTKLLLAAFGFAIALSLFLAKLTLCKKACDGIVNCFKKLITAIKNNKKKLITALLGTAIIIAFSLVVEKLYSAANALSFNGDKSLVIFAVIEMIFLAVLFWKSIATKPERIFAVVAFLVGLICIQLVPNALGTMWDDETHYWRTAQASYLFTNRFSYSDYQNIGHCQRTTFDRDVYGIENESLWNERINGDAENVNTILHEKSQIYLPANVSYVPGALGLMFARAFHMSYTSMFAAGKIANLLAYICCYYFAIKIVKRGKFLIIALALVPTSIFMASSYSYDGWILSMLALGYALFINACQKAEEGQKIGKKRIFGIFLVLLLALLPKAIYFPLVFPLLVACRYYVKKDSKRFYWFACIFTAFILVFSFVAPMLITSGDYQTDERGGDDVNAPAQIAFVMNNPLKFAKILFGFIKEYISLDHSGEYIAYMGHLGMGRYYVLALVTIIVVAFLEGKLIEQKLGIKFKILLLATCFITVILVVSALYVSFTPVGLDTVKGCQYRYLLPFLFPLFYYVLSSRLEAKHMNKSMLGFITMGIMAAVTIANMYSLTIAIS